VARPTSREVRMRRLGRRFGTHVSEVKSYLDDEMTFQARKRFNRHQTATISGGSGTILAADP